MLRRRPILIIEDSDDDYTFLEICLRNSGVTNRLTRCATGKEIDAFLEEAKSYESLQRPIFVFLDLNFPGAQGIDVLKRLKAHPTLVAIPVVVLTTSSQQRDIDKSYRLGASGFLTKPLDFEKFEEMVKQVAEYWFACVRLPDNVGLPGS